jgi:hypothetical protein
MLTKSKKHDNDALRELCRDGAFSDLEIKVQGKAIKAHKILLAAKSLVFAEKLCENQNVLELNGLEFEVAEQMINFIYDGKVRDMEKYAKPLLEAAEKFEIAQLQVYCEKYLYENLCVDNAIETLKLSAKCDSVELKNECADFIVE